MPGDRGPLDDAVLSPGMKRGVAAACFIGFMAVVSYLTSPNTGHDLGTALAIALAVVFTVAVLLALRWLAVRPRP